MAEEHTAKRSKIEEEIDQDEIIPKLNNQSEKSAISSAEVPPLLDSAYFDLPSLVDCEPINLPVNHSMPVTTEELINPQSDKKCDKESENKIDEKIAETSCSASSKSTETTENNKSDNSDEKMQQPGPSDDSKITNKLNSIRKRNYRARKLSSSSSDSSSNEHVSPKPTEENQNIEEPSESSNSITSSVFAGTDDSNTSYNFSQVGLGFSDNEDNEDNDEEDSQGEPSMNSIQEILTKEKPKYNINLTYEIMNREHGLSGIGYGRYTSKESIHFNNSINNSRQTIEKMKLMHKLKKHRGCVNSLNFNKSGNLLCTGSDDLKICVWNWSTNKLKFAFQTGHQANVFQSKFIESNSDLSIVSSSRDGEVRYHKIPPSGGSKVKSSVLCKHHGSVHKIAICPSNTNEILSAGDDGYVIRSDLRENPSQRIVQVKDQKGPLSMYSISHHPFDAQFCVSGCSRYVYVYDKRNITKPIELMSPNIFDDKVLMYITCAVYNKTGSEILASYSGEDIYLFNNRCYIKGSFSKRYRGRSNIKTIKGVNFFGPNSEYILSGSDCGNLFFWDKNTESIVNWSKGDVTGIVNCLEPHPAFPILATSGLDYEAKIWGPTNEEYPPQMEGLEKCIRENLKSFKSNKSYIDDRKFFLFVRHYFRNSGRNSNDTLDMDENILTSSSSDNESDADEVRVPCALQ